MIKVYISGAISSLDYREAFDNFQQIEEKLKEAGVTNFFNPMREIDPTLPYRTQMDRCLEALKTCDCILLQNNWRDSPGAREELTHAGNLKMHIRYDTPADFATFKIMIQRKAALVAKLLVNS